MWSPGVTLEAIEKQVILKAFQFYRGNKTQTSIALGISIRTLDNKLAQYKEESSQQQEREDAQREREADFQRRSRGLAKTPISSVQTKNGEQLESVKDVPEKSPMPLSERKKVQDLPPRQATPSGDTRTSGRIHAGNGKR